MAWDMDGIVAAELFALVAPQLGIALGVAVCWPSLPPGALR